MCETLRRLVEGDIFRIGMYLEDIKEMIDKNVCEQISPPHSSSTPTSMNEMLHAKPCCMSTPSSPPSLHEVIGLHLAKSHSSPQLFTACYVNVSWVQPAVFYSVEANVSHATPFTWRKY